MIENVRCGTQQIGHKKRRGAALETFLYTLRPFCFTEEVLPMAYTHTRDCGKQHGVYGNKLEYSKDANVHQGAANLSRAAADSQKNLFPISSRDLPRH